MTYFCTQVNSDFSLRCFLPSHFFTKHICIASKINVNDFPEESVFLLFEIVGLHIGGSSSQFNRFYWKIYLSLNNYTQFIPFGISPSLFPSFFNYIECLHSEHTCHNNLIPGVSLFPYFTFNIHNRLNSTYCLISDYLGYCTILGHSCQWWL